MPDYTVVIPTDERPNFVALTVQGFARHATLNPKILIVNSRPEPHRCWPYDWLQNEAGERYQKYHSMAHWYDANPELVDRFSVEIIDIPDDEMQEFRNKCNAGQIEGCPRFEAGCEIAYKNNVGMKRVETEWVFPNWDDDFYPGPGFDLSLINRAKMPEWQGQKVVFIPRHIQPRNPIEIAHCNANGSASPINPWLPVRENTQSVTDEDWVAYCSQNAKDMAIMEPCAARIILHWLPLMFRTSDFSKFGEYSYMGVCYDVEYDDRLAKNGYSKVCDMKSFILHKGFPFRNEDEI